MRQSNIIFGALAVAFVVFITTRGSLPTYMSILFGTATAPSDGKSTAGQLTSKNLGQGADAVGVIGRAAGSGGAQLEGAMKLLGGWLGKK